MNYALHLIVMIGIYLPLVYSLNLTIGFGGLISFCHAAFYGIGAYSYSILITKAGIDPLVALPATVLVTSMLAGIIGIVSLRFRGDLFLFVTLGFQMIIFVIIYNWVALTNGPYGIPDIPRPEIFGFIFRKPIHFVALAGMMNILLLVPLFIIYRSPFGITLKALREDETAAESLGICPRNIYLQALVISSSFAAIPGVLYATYVTYIDPTSFTLKESIFQIAILLLGGAGNKMGPLIGVIIMLLLPEALRFVGLPDAIAHNLREIIYGLLLAILMYFRPQGLAGEFKMA